MHTRRLAFAALLACLLVPAHDVLEAQSAPDVATVVTKADVEKVTGARPQLQLLVDIARSHA